MGMGLRPGLAYGAGKATMKAGHWQVFIVAVGAGLLLSGCGMGSCGPGDDGHMDGMGSCANAEANPGAGNGDAPGGGNSGGTAYFIETVPNASSAGGNTESVSNAPGAGRKDANVDLTVYSAASIALPIAHDGDGLNGGLAPPYYAKTQVTLNPGQTIYLRASDAGGWGGYYSIRIRASSFLGSGSTGTAGHPDVYDTANGALPPGGADDVHTGATALLLDVVHDHGFWPAFDTDWSVFTAP